MIIGLSGTNGSGKDTVAHILVEKFGYYFASASGMLVEELKKQGLPEERKYTSALSAQWRREHGLGVIVDKALEKVNQLGNDKLVVGSLRNPGEADRVHELEGLVIWVDADPKIRYDRISGNARGRQLDNKTYEEFLAEEEDEMKQAGDENVLNMSAVKQKADMFIENNFDTIEEFEAEVLTKLEEYLR